MRVFVTGGTGLVGSHTIQQLISRGDEVLALARSDRAAAELRALGAEPLTGDVTDAAALAKGVASADAVVHAAAAVLSDAGWDTFAALNVAPTGVIAREAAKRNARLVHISSVAVYGRRTTYDGGAASVSEDFGLDRPLFPGDHYARSKREAEQLLWRVCEDTGHQAVALRPCVIYGERDRAFAIRVARALKRRIAPLIGDGANPLSVVYAGNVAAAAVAALGRSEAFGAFNVANDGAVSQREFFATFAKALGITPLFVRVNRSLAWGAASAADALLRLFAPRAPMALLKTAVQFLGAANPFVSTRAERELGWRPLVPPAEAIARTARSFR